MKHRVQSLLIAAIAIACSFSSVAASTSNADAGELARDAFFAIEADPFNREVTTKAFRDIDLAYQQAPQHPWVLIAISRALLEWGYKYGDQSKLSSYDAESVEKASDYAKQAIEFGKNESMAYIQWAKIQIITENYKGAWETLNQAHRLDKANFYPWYYRAVLSLRMNDPKRANDVLDEAEKLAKLSYQKYWVVRRRTDVAYLNKDVAAEEKYYKQAISLAPSAPHPYGNYASFLKRRKRYDEAILYYEKALAISPYPLAEEQLRKTRLLRDAIR